MSRAEGWYSLARSAAFQPAGSAAATTGQSVKSAITLQEKAF